jgi:hypothetical protein
MSKAASGTTASDPKAAAPAPPAGTDPPPAVQNTGSGVQSDDDRQKRVEESYQTKPDEDGGDQQQGNDQADNQDQGQGQDQQQQVDDAPAAPAPVPAGPPARRAVAVAAAPPAVPVAAAPVAAVPVAAAPPPKVVAVAPGYDKMVAQAEDLINNSQYDEASDLLKKAIASNPAKWQAYNSLAKVQLYFTHDPTSAFQNYAAALAHGGQASFYVYHDLGTGEFASTDSGWLMVSRGKVAFKADDGVHSFPTTPVKEAKKNKFFGKIFSASGKSAHAFHVHLMNNQNLNLAPSSAVPGPETDFILKAIATGE